MSEFQGYHRHDGQVGVRNHLLVMSIGGLTGAIARRVAAALRKASCVVLPYETGLVGQDKATHDRTALGFALNANVGAVLLIGDNPSSLEAIVERLKTAEKPCVALGLDDCGNDAITLTERATRFGAGLVRQISTFRRALAPISALTLGLECGRSDPSSGLVANPLLGQIADRFISAGGSAILGETMEWLGAEHLIAARAKNPEVATDIVDAVTRREAAAVAAGIDLLGTNPTSTNIAAGLSTIEEKSLGSVAKSGTQPIEGLLQYGQAPAHSGLWLMDAPAYAPESLSGFVAAGAQLILFTTGVGNSYVSLLAPTIKISANSATTSRLDSQLDFDAHAAFYGDRTLDYLAVDLENTIIEIASGTATWGEVLGEGDEVVSRFGPAL